MYGAFFLNRVANPTTICQPVKENPTHIHLHFHPPPSSPDLVKVPKAQVQTQVPEVQTQAQAQAQTREESFIMDLEWAAARILEIKNEKRTLREAKQDLEAREARLIEAENRYRDILPLLPLAKQLQDPTCFAYSSQPGIDYYNIWLMTMLLTSI